MEAILREVGKKKEILAVFGCFSQCPILFWEGERTK
jgi:hypothetical protein